MADEAQRAVTMIVRLRTAQRDVARAHAVAAEQALAQAEDDGARRIAERDAALAAWRQRLDARRPDPMLVRLAGTWVAACERAVAAADLDTRIAAGRRDVLRGEAQQSDARLDVATQVRRDRARDMARRRDTSEAAEAADRFLMGRRA